MPVVFSDWEAVNAGPALWDLAYLSVLSQRSEQRRQRQPSLLGAYLAALRRRKIVILSRIACCPSR